MPKIKHEDLIENNIFDDAIKGAQALRTEYQKLYADLQKQIVIKIDTQSGASSNSKFGQDIIKQTNKDVKDLEKVYADYGKKLEVITQLQDQLSNVQKQYNNASNETKKAILAEAEALRQKNDQDKLDIKVMSTQEGSLARLRAELSKQKATLVNDLKIGTEAYNKQQKAVADLTTQVKKEEEAIGVHTRSVGQYEKAIEGIKGAIVGVTAIVGSMYGAIEFGKKVIDSTGTSQEAFAVYMKGMEDATAAFFRTIANGDWSNLLTNMQEAMRAGKEYQEVMNDLEHRKRSYTIQESQTMVKVDEDLEKSRRKDLYTEEQRKGFILEAITLEKNLADMKVKNSDIEFKKTTDYYAALTKLDKATLLTFVKEYSNNEKLIEQAKELNDKKTRLANLQIQSHGSEVASAGMSGMGSGGFVTSTPGTKDSADLLQKEINSASPIVSGFADIIQKYGNLNKAAMDKLVESWKGLGDAQQEVYTNTMRSEGRLATLNTQIEGEKAKGIAAAAKAQAKADKEAEQHQAALEKSGSELRKEYDAGLKETIKAEDDKYKTLKSMGLLTQDEIIKHEMDSFVTSAQFALMTEKEKLAAIKEMHDKAMQDAGKNGKATPEADTVQVDDASTPVDNAIIPSGDALEGALGKFREFYAKHKAIIQEFTKDAQQLLSFESKAISNNEKKQLEESKSRYDADYAALDAQLANKTISQKDYNTKKKALEEKQKQDELKIQKDAAKKQKEVQLIQAIINTALAVTSALLTQPFMPMGLIAAVAAGIMGGLEIATIESSSFAEGGSGVIDKKKGGKLRGKRHSQGGIPLPGIGTAEDGEYFGILNRSATSKYGDATLGLIFEALNQQKFEKLFQTTNPLTVNVSDHYQKKIYEELSKPKHDATVQIIGNKRVVTQGNHTLITSV